MLRRSFIKGLLAVPLAVRAAQVLAAKPTVQEPPARPRDSLPEGWTQVETYEAFDASIFVHDSGKSISVSSIAIKQGSLPSILKNHERLMR